MVGVHAFRWGGAPSTPLLEGLYSLECFVLYGNILELNEVSHVDWKTQVGALFVSGLGLHPTTINRAPPPSFLLANLQES